jgi:hypothetical protein
MQAKHAFPIIALAALLSSLDAQAGVALQNDSEVLVNGLKLDGVTTNAIKIDDTNGYLLFNLDANTAR